MQKHIYTTNNRERFTTGKARANRERIAFAYDKSANLLHIYKNGEHRQYIARDISNIRRIVQYGNWITIDNKFIFSLDLQNVARYFYISHPFVFLNHKYGSKCMFIEGPLIHDYKQRIRDATKFADTHHIITFKDNTRKFIDIMPPFIHHDYVIQGDTLYNTNDSKEYLTQINLEEIGNFFTIITYKTLTKTIYVTNSGLILYPLDKSQKLYQSCKDGIVVKIGEMPSMYKLLCSMLEPTFTNFKIKKNGALAMQNIVGYSQPV